ncbi:MAG: hypothetical protein HRT61_22430, partial [Ekhidna sp.]|nr:hypothetical protein [Ekhidna sp.]
MRYAFEYKLINPIAFDLYLRKPNWSDEVLDKEGTLELSAEREGFYKVSKEWSNETFTIEFKNPIKKIETGNEQYVQRGALVYAYPISHRQQTIKEYRLKGFKDYYCFPTDDQFSRLSFSDQNLIFNGLAKDVFPWYNDLTSIEGI